MNKSNNNYQVNPMISNSSNKQSEFISPSAVYVEPLEIYSSSNENLYTRLDNQYIVDSNNLHANAYREAEEIRRKLALSHQDGLKLTAQQDIGVLKSHIEGVKLSNQQQKLVSNYAEGFADSDMPVYNDTSSFPTAPTLNTNQTSTYGSYKPAGPPVMSSYQSIYDSTNGNQSGYQTSEYKSIYD